MTLSRFLIIYGANNEMATFEANGYEHAIEQFISWAPVGPTDEENRAAINEVSLMLPMTAIDNAVLAEGLEPIDIEWRSQPRGRLWIGVNGKLDVKIKHDDGGIVIDVYENGSVGDDLVSTWVEWPAEEEI